METVYLVRTHFKDIGITGELYYEKTPGSEDYETFATLEHAYPESKFGWMPKLPDGVYTMVKGKHQLEHGGPFIAFEITGVDGHTGILIHVGNVNKDSDGCVLLGMYGDPNAVYDSNMAFNKFMARFANADKVMIDVSTDTSAGAA